FPYTTLFRSLRFTAFPISRRKKLGASQWEHLQNKERHWRNSVRQSSARNPFGNVPCCRAKPCAVAAAVLHAPTARSRSPIRCWSRPAARFHFAATELAEEETTLS